MKAISIHPEPVMEILSGKKIEEYRSWSTHHRGPLLICSTAIKTPGCISGHAVCIVDLVDVKKLDEESYAWIFSEVRCIKPFPIKGQRRLYHVPDDRIVEPEAGEFVIEAGEKVVTEEFWQEYYLSLIQQ
ncbi:ASCH domain-containing protein [Candidatus Enterococcus murrayae]|uniref:ASCH domain-containing protein n=1 Tax=Candidatus Enterococcus murrayae TaxID=2815321 RepID=A0ABS3HHN3_9ENTE|nr:ASCH domain-containing protein [Enterococcus sp. MJM16]MBO0452944.1 ASCH domain-containing protein [Enterococcus sp. MJM16]